MTAYDTLPDISNLKYDDIRDTLNANGGSVNNVFSSFFQTSAGINAFSKHKPVVQPVVITDTDAVFGIGNSSLPMKTDWWRAKDGFCGFSIPELSNQENTDDDALWEYVLPSGGAASPFRIGDFRKYNSKAPSGLLAMNNWTQIYEGQDLNISVQVNTSQTANDALSFYDIFDNDLVPSTTPYYLCCSVFTETSTPLVKKQVLGEGEGAASPDVHIFRFTPTELQSLGIRSSFYYHLYVEGAGGKRFSIRYADNVMTKSFVEIIEDISVSVTISMSPPRVQVSSPYIINIQPITFIVNGGTQGGTIPECKCGLWPYYPDYEGYMYPESDALFIGETPSITVKAGESKSYVVTEGATAEWRFGISDRMVKCYVYEKGASSPVSKPLFNSNYNVMYI